MALCLSKGRDYVTGDYHRSSGFVAGGNYNRVHNERLHPHSSGNSNHRSFVADHSWQKNPVNSQKSGTTATGYVFCRATEI
jgi:hypothetical protein